MNLFMLLDSTTTGTEGGAGGLGSMLGMILPLVFVFVLMYFFMIRPQKKQEQKEAQMRDNLQVGDEVTTIGGIIGRVVNVKDDTFVLETTRERTKIRFERTALKRIDRKFDAPETTTEATEATAEETASAEKKN